MAFSLAMDFHPGEEKMHNLLKVPNRDNPTSAMLTPQASFMLQRAPLLALGTLDSKGRPWTTLWGGNPGFSQPLGAGIIGTRTLVDGTNDPVVQALVGGSKKGEMVRGDPDGDGKGKLVAGLTIDLMTRKRVKIASRMVAGSLEEVDVDWGEGGIEMSAEDRARKQDQFQLVTKIEESLGNCPKYLNQYDIRPAPASSKVISDSAGLTDKAANLIRKADMFFLSSSTTKDMDTNHRGGPPGFVRILSSSPTQCEIVYPEYSGNRLYQSLGNLQLNPKIGVTFPDYETGDVLYLTGEVEILLREAASSTLPGSNLAVKIKASEIKFVEKGLAFRGAKKIPSPYNPLVRTLVTEGNIKSNIHASGTQKVATLVKKTQLTSTIARFKFEVPEGIKYEPGQWVALDFSKDLDIGYSHMRDDDPRSLNDDYVRTFTISSSPLSACGDDVGDKDFEITIRNVGVVTNYLFRQSERAGFQVPIVGVGGDFRIHQIASKGVTPFVAGGVGITPLLGELPHLNLSEDTFKLLWSIPFKDIHLVLDVLRQFPKLGSCTSLFLTGKVDEHMTSSALEEVQVLGASHENRRILTSDLEGVQADTWYLCASKPLRKQLLDWLGKESVIFEDFDY